MKEYITVGGIKYEIRRNARRKHIALGVEDGIFFVAAPSSASRKTLETVLARDGADMRLKLTRRAAQPSPEHLYEEGKRFYYRGELYPLRFVKPAGIHPVRLEEGEFLAFEGLSAQELKHDFEVWYRLSLSRIIQSEFPSWCKKIGAVPRTVSLKHTKTLWGSCSATGGITFNIRLALVPPPLAEYVMIHELCHMTEMNHSPRFWALVAKYCPDFAARRKELKQEGAKYKW